MLYRPLKEKEIRVLEILPGADEDDMHCRLQYTNLDDPIEYNALSYTWGDPTKPKIPITIDGYFLEVTENCRLALQELRREATAASKIQTIWIDAICMNQTDIAERSHQVLSMRSIYRKSKKLIVWLGTEADGSADLIEFLFKQFPDRHNQEACDQFEWKFAEDPDHPNRRDALAAFFSRPWFTRIWVIQEYAVCAQKDADQLSTDTVEFYCGASRLSSKQFENFVLFSRLLETTRQEMEWEINNEKLFRSKSRGTFCVFRILIHTLTEYLPQSQRDTANQFIIDVFGGLDFECTEPRDRVYAHLGWITDFQSDLQVNDPSGIPKFAAEGEASTLDGSGFPQAGGSSVDDLSNLIIDYNAPIEDIYSSLVRYTILAVKNLNILSFCHQERRTGTNSWSLDLSIMSSVLSDYKGGKQTPTDSNFLLYKSVMGNKRHKTFRASNDAEAIAKFNDLSILSVQGFRLTVVQICFGIGIFESDNGVPFLLSKHLLEILSEELLDRGVYDSRDKRCKALWTTWTGGSIVKDEHTLFEKWLSWLDTDVQKLGKASSVEVLDKWRSLAPGDETWIGISYPQNRRDLFRMNDRKIAKAWDSTKPGDILCIILGCDVPLVLRPVDNHFELIGECYVDGIMEGQAMKDLEEGKVKLETFDLH